MNDLRDLKELLIANGVEFSEFTGYSIKTGKDTWGMAHGEYYKNGKLVTRNELKTTYPKRK